jgi:hypothetical protein
VSFALALPLPRRSFRKAERYSPASIIWGLSRWRAGWPGSPPSRPRPAPCWVSLPLVVVGFRMLQQSRGIEEAASRAPKPVASASFLTDQQQGPAPPVPVKCLSGHWRLRPAGEQELGVHGHLSRLVDDFQPIRDFGQPKGGIEVSPDRCENFRARCRIKGEQGTGCLTSPSCQSRMPIMRGVPSL